MNLNVNILLIIVTYQSSKVWTSQFGSSTIQPLNVSTTPKQLYKKYTLDYLLSPNRTDFYDCLLWVPFEDYNMPIPVTIDSSSPKLINPNLNGNLIIKQNKYFKLVCSESFFVKPIYNRAISEITVKCLNKSLIEYRNRAYNFNKFVCKFTPKPDITITNDTCQNNNNTKILEVGFYTRNGFLKFYKICFDTMLRNPLYVWYNLKTPYFKRRQVYTARPAFSRTNLYGVVDVDNRYKHQRGTLATILNSTRLANHYIKYYDKEHFLSRGHLIARTEFNYAFEQLATFYFENTVPQWQKFNEGVWREIEKLFKRIMAKSVSRHVVITGSYDVCTLPDVSGIQRPLFLSLPNSIAVPLYLWKIDYDLNKKTGVVFIGMNNPYKTDGQQNVHICNVIECPGILINQNIPKSLFYCCDMESFEKTYGKLDPIVFETI